VQSDTGDVVDPLPPGGRAGVTGRPSPVGGSVKTRVGSRSRLQRYGLAVLLVSAVAAFSLAACSASGEARWPAHFLIGAVAVAAWRGGWGPGLLAAALGGLALDLLFEEPRFSLALEDPETLPDLLGFLAVAAVIAWGNGRLGAARAASEAARRGLEELLDAADDSVIVYAADGRVARTNRSARERLTRDGGAAPATGAEMAALARWTRPDGTPHATPPFEQALRGRTADGLVVLGEAASARRFFVRAVPLRTQDGGVRGALSIWRDVTELYEAVPALTRLDATLKTLRRVSHEIGNAVSPVRAWSELLPEVDPEETPILAQHISDAADRVAGVLDRFRNVTRYAETELGGTVMLDLDACARLPRIELDQGAGGAQRRWSAPEGAP